MKTIVNFVKKPVVWITGLIVAIVAGILTLVFAKRK